MKFSKILVFLCLITLSFGLMGEDKQVEGQQEDGDITKAKAECCTTCSEDLPISCAYVGEKTPGAIITPAEETKEVTKE